MQRGIDNFFTPKNFDSAITADSTDTQNDSSFQNLESQTSSNNGFACSSTSSPNIYGPSYPDIGTLTKEDLRKDDDVILKLLTTKWEDPKFHFPTSSRRHILEVNPPQIHLSSYLTGGLKKLYHHLKSECLDIPIYEPGQFTNDHGHFQLAGSCIMASRYRIIHVISTSGQSAVLLRAEDMFREDEVVVIKVLHITFSHIGIQETHCLHQLRSVDPEDISHTLRLFNVFTFDGHYCMVFEALYPDPINKIFQKIHREKLLPNIRKVALRLLTILGFLQRENVIHADLKPDNILLKKNGGNNDESTLYNKCIEDDLGSLKVIDFGNAIHHVHKEVSLYYEDFEVQTPLYRAPEVIFGIPFGSEIDMWSVGCILAELYAGKPLFFGTDETTILKQMTEILGLLPTHIFQRGKFYHKLKTYTGNSPQINVCEILMKHLECRDYKFCSFLAGCLQYNPDKRLKSNEAALHPFLAPELPVGFLMDLHKENIYPSVYAPDYSHNPYVSSDIKRSQPSSRDLLRIGTSIIEADISDSDTSSCHSTGCPVAKVIPFNNQTEDQNQKNLQNGNLSQGLALPSTDSYQQQIRQRRSQENIKKEITIQNKSSNNRFGDSVEDKNQGITIHSYNTHQNTLHNYQGNSNQAFTVPGTKNYQHKNRQRNSQESMNQESTRTFAGTYSRQNTLKCSYNDENKKYLQCSPDSMSSTSDNGGNQENNSSPALQGDLQTSKHEFKKENTPKTQPSITLYRLNAFSQNSPGVFQNSKSSEQLCIKEDFAQENRLQADYVNYKENPDRVGITKKIQSQIKSQPDMMNKRLSGENDYFNEQPANVVNTDKWKGGYHRNWFRQNTQIAKTKPNNYKDVSGLSFSPLQPLRQGGYTRQCDMNGSSDSQNKDKCLLKGEEGNVTVQSHTLLGDKRSQIDFGGDKLYKKSPSFKIRMGTISDESSVMDNNEIQSPKIASRRGDQNSRKFMPKGELYSTNIPSSVNKYQPSENLEHKDTKVFSKQSNKDSYRGLNNVQQRSNNTRKFKTALPCQTSSEINMEEFVDSFEHVCDEARNTDRDDYRYQARKQGSCRLDTSPKSKTITNGHELSHEKSSSSSRKRSLNCLNRMNQKRRKFLTKPSLNSEGICMATSEHQNDLGYHFDMYYSDGYESGPEQGKRLSDQTNIRHDSKVNSCSKMRSSKTNRIGKVLTTESNTSPGTAPSCDQTDFKMMKNNSDSSKPDSVGKRQLTCISSADNTVAGKKQIQASHQIANQLNQAYIVRQNFVDIASSNVDVLINSQKKNQFKGRIKCNPVSSCVKKQRLPHSSKDNNDMGLNENKWIVEQGSKLSKPTSISKRKEIFDITSPVVDKQGIKISKPNSISKRKENLDVTSPVVDKQGRKMSKPTSISKRKEDIEITSPAVDKQVRLFHRNVEKNDRRQEIDIPKREFSKSDNESQILQMKDVSAVANTNLLVYNASEKARKRLLFSGALKPRYSKSLLSKDRIHINAKSSVLSKCKLKKDSGVSRDTYEFELTPDKKIALINSQNKKPKRFQKKVSKTKTTELGSEERFHNKADGGCGSHFVNQTSASFDLHLTADNISIDNQLLTYGSSENKYKNLKEKGGLDAEIDRKAMRETQHNSPLLARNEMNKMATNSGLLNIMSPPSGTKRLVSSVEKEYNQPKTDKSIFSEARSISKTSQYSVCSQGKNIDTKQQRATPKLFTRMFSPSHHRKADMLLPKQDYVGAVSRDSIRSPADDHVSLIMSEDEFSNVCSDQDDNSDEEVMLLTL